MFFFCNDTATTEIYTLSLHDALPILSNPRSAISRAFSYSPCESICTPRRPTSSLTKSSFTDSRLTSSKARRSEEHTSELQSRQYLVCRLLLETKNPPSSLYSRTYLLF